MYSDAIILPIPLHVHITRNCNRKPIHSNNDRSTESHLSIHLPLTCYTCQGGSPGLLMAHQTPSTSPWGSSDRDVTPPAAPGPGFLHGWSLPLNLCLKRVQGSGSRGGLLTRCLNYLRASACTVSCNCSSKMPLMVLCKADIITLPPGLQIFCRC